MLQLLFLSLNSAAIVEAGTAKLDAFCRTDVIAGMEDVVCDESQDLFCDTNRVGSGFFQDPAEGLCSKIASVQCTCQNQGVSGVGKNGFTCEGGPVAYCGDPSEACFPAGAEYHPEEDGADELYPGKQIRGVRCDAQKQAQCTCANPNTPGSGQNGINCTAPGLAPGSGYCDQAGDACVPGGSMDEDGTEQLGEDAGGKYNDTTLNGVHCGALAKEADKAYPTVPPPPPPPCLVALTAEGCPSFSTAIGELGTKPEQFITSLFAVLLSISGGIALLLIIRAGYQMMTSQGEPQKLNNARDHLIAAIVGLIFLIFSFVVLQIIGFDILRIEGFGA